MADEQTKPHEQDDPNWLRRQIRRLRDLRRRNVVIAQVGQGARNVVIGTRNVQINIGDRNLTLPVLAVPLLLLAIVGFLVYPLLQPLWNPGQMTGQFRIAVAEFGQIDSTGKLRRSENGRVLSRWLFEALRDEYQENADVGPAGGIEVWHDSRRGTDQNFGFGVMGGDTAQARRAAAAKLAERINAHMIIYGTLIADGGSLGLDLEFYLSPLVNDETASILGPHRLGKPIVLPVPFDTGQPETNVVVNEKLQVRTEALFWLTVGLTQQLLGRSDQALETFQRADQTLSDWLDSDGKEILHFFIGREQLTLGQSDQAEVSFRRALDIDPDYARAQVAVGSTYWRRAFDVNPEKRLDDPRYLEQAIDHHLKGLDLALSDGEPLVEAVARIALAKSYRLMGETYYVLDEDAQANRLFDQAIDQAKAAMPLLADMRQYRLLAQAYEVLGAAYLQQGAVLQGQREVEQSRARLELAKDAYQSCIEQGNRAPFDEILQEKVIAQGCRRNIQIAEEYLQRIGEEQL